MFICFGDLFVLNLNVIDGLRKLLVVCVMDRLFSMNMNDNRIVRNCSVCMCIESVILLNMK